MALNFGQPQSMYVDQGSVQISENLRNRFAQNFAAADELQAQLDMLQAADFEGDQKLKKTLEQSTRQRLEQLSNRGDYENLTLQVAKSGREFKSAYAPIKQNYEAYQNYVQNLAQRYKDGEIDAETYQRALPYAKNKYSGLQMTPEGTVDQNSFFSGPALVKDVNVANLVNDELKGIVADKLGQETTIVGQGPGGSMVITNGVKTETISADRVQSIYNEVLGRPDVQAALGQKANLRTFDLSAEDKAGRVTQDLANYQNVIGEMQSALQSPDFSKQEKVSIANQMDLMQRKIDQLKAMDPANLDDYIAQREIQGILAPIEEAVMAKNVYTKTETKYAQSYDPLWMEYQKQSIKDASEKRKEQQLELASQVAIKGVNTFEFNLPVSAEEYSSSINALRGSIAEYEEDIANGALSDTQRQQAKDQLLQAKNQYAFELQQIEEVAKATQSSKELLPIDFDSPNWLNNIPTKMREEMNDMMTDENSPYYYKKVYEPTYQTSEGKEFKAFETALKDNLFAGGITESMKVYELGENNAVDLYEEGVAKDAGEMDLSGLTVTDVAVTRQGMTGIPLPSNGEFVLVTLSGKQGDEDVKGKQLLLPMDQFDAGFVNAYTSTPAYRLNSKMEGIKMSRSKVGNFDVEVSVQTPEGIVRHPLKIKMSPTGRRDEVQITYPNGATSKVMSLSEALNDPLVLGDANIIDIHGI